MGGTGGGVGGGGTGGGNGPTKTGGVGGNFCNMSGRCTVMEPQTKQATMGNCCNANNSLLPQKPSRLRKHYAYHTVCIPAECLLVVCVV